MHNLKLRNKNLEQVEGDKPLESVIYEKVKLEKAIHEKIARTGKISKKTITSQNQNIISEKSTILQ